MTTSFNVLPIAIIVIAIVLVVAFLSACYRKAAPTEALVITGLGHKEPKVICGKGSIVIPILQRVDKILMRLMKVDVKTPETGVKTSEGVPLFLDAVVTTQVYSNSSTVSLDEINACGCKDKEEYIKIRQQAAISNFLGYNEEQISDKVIDVLQGNLREIVATMSVTDLLTKRKEFAESVIENARPDLAKMGLEVVTFNIQDIKDAIDSHGSCHGVVESIGVQREMEVKREAEKARAEAQKDIDIAKAEAERETVERQNEAERKKAEAANALALRKAELKAQEDKANADAEAAGKIQEQIQEKTRREAAADVEIAAQEKEILRAEKEAEVKQRQLDAEVRKKADAEKYEAQKRAEAERYRAEQEAEADKLKRERDAEAFLITSQKKAEAAKVAAEAAKYEKEQAAAGIAAVGEAEARAISAKGIAEAEAIEKKAEAMKKYGEAAMLEMVVKALPDIAAAVAKPMENIEKITIFDGAGNGTGVSSMSSYVPSVMAKTFETVKEITGVDMADIMRADTIDAKVKRDVSLTGIPSSEVAGEIGKYDAKVEETPAVKAESVETEE